MICPHCGQDSVDEAFCDHCNRDMVRPAPRPRLGPMSCVQPPELLRVFEDAIETGIRRYEGRWLERAVIAFEAPADQLAALLSATRDEGGRCIVPELIAVPSSSVDNTDKHWALALLGSARGDWARSLSAAATSEDECTRVGTIIDAITPLLGVLTRLHHTGGLWLNFDPIEVVRPWSSDQSVRLLNLIGRRFSSGALPSRLAVSTFAPPEIASFQAHAVGPATDVFQFGVLLYLVLAGLFPEGLPGGGLEALHFRLPPIRTFRPTLPPSLDPILRRATAPLPSNRFRSIDALCDALLQSKEEIMSRARSPMPTPTLAWGSSTTIGRVKATLCPENQDRVYPAPGERPEMLVTIDEPFGLLAVADGVSTCRVGSGTRAASLTIEAVANIHQRIVTEARDVLDPAGRPGNAERKTARELINEIPVLATHAILRTLPEQTQDPSGIMTSTLVAAWIDRARATIASVGDSRCYLVTRDYCEQLTRDDDVETLLMAEGGAPEEISELPDADRKALRRIVGALRRSSAGTLEPDLDRIRPTILELGLLPGDVLLLCSDGLIEEGLFLDVEEASAIIRAGAGEAVGAVAQKLVAAADERQRLPRNGDNISCVLVRVCPPTAPSNSASRESQGLTDEPLHV